jgi:hypothetical protein
MSAKESLRSSLTKMEKRESEPFITGSPAILLCDFESIQNILRRLGEGSLIVPSQFCRERVGGEKGCTVLVPSWPYTKSFINAVAAEWVAFGRESKTMRRYEAMQVLQIVVFRNDRRKRASPWLRENVFYMCVVTQSQSASL